MEGKKGGRKEKGKKDEEQERRRREIEGEGEEVGERRMEKEKGELAGCFS